MAQANKVGEADYVGATLHPIRRQPTTETGDDMYITGNYSTPNTPLTGLLLGVDVHS
jgi:hypothetical protein